MKCIRCDKEQERLPHYSRAQWARREFCSKRCRGIVRKPATLIHNKPHTQATKFKLRLLNLGKPGPNLGRPMPESVREKIRQKLLGSQSFLWIDGRSNDLEYQRFRGRQKWARRRTAGGSHTLEQWKWLKECFGFQCPSCGKREPYIRLTEDHVTPVTRGGTNWIWNIQPLCQRCNSAKQFSIKRFGGVA